MNTTATLFDADEVRRCAAVLLSIPGDVVEVRCLEATTARDAYPHVRSGYFDDAEKIIKALPELKSATGIYATLNPTVPALWARAGNRLKKQSARGGTTSDHDIAGRRRILIDCDANRPAGISSTDAEHGAAMMRAAMIREDLEARGWPSPALADSGNGAHLIFEVEPEATPELIRRVLETIHQQHGDDAVKVDCAVFNPARITKLYGTLVCKGDDTTDRPHRLSKIIDLPDRMEQVTVEQLTDLAAEHAEPEPAKPSTNTNGNHNGKAAKVNRHKLDAGEWMRTHRIDADGPEPYQGGERWSLPVCPWNPDHTGGSAFVIQLANGAISAGCRHDSCSSKKWADLREKYEQNAGHSRAEHRTSDSVDEALADAVPHVATASLIGGAVTRWCPRGWRGRTVAATPRRGTH